jgi:hypothetical protein
MLWSLSVNGLLEMIQIISMDSRNRNSVLRF